MLEKQLHKLGLERARVTAVATKAGQGAAQTSQNTTATATWAV